MNQTTTTSSMAEETLRRHFEQWCTGGDSRNLPAIERSGSGCYRLMQTQSDWTAWLAAQAAIAKATQAPAESKWAMPQEPELFKFINATPLAQSLLYELDLMPEQISSAARWGDMVTVCEHIRIALATQASA